MGSARIVKLDPLLDGQVSDLFTRQFGSQTILLLEYPIHPLSQRILSAMVGLGHADPQARLLQTIDILMATILRALVGVVNGSTAFGQFGQRTLQRPHT